LTATTLYFQSRKYARIPERTLPSKIDDNPMMWMINVNGTSLDARYLSREVQEEAYKRGLIPYLPEE